MSVTKYSEVYSYHVNSIVALDGKGVLHVACLWQAEWVNSQELSFLKPKLDFWYLNKISSHRN